MLGRVLCSSEQFPLMLRRVRRPSDPLNLASGAVYPPTQEVTLSGFLVPTAPYWGLSLTPVEGPLLHQGIYSVWGWIIMMWRIWIFVVEFLFHIKIVIPWSEIMLICLSHILVQCGMVFPHEVIISIPFYSKLELPFAVGILGPS
jgi:hypothetical protein